MFACSWSGGKDSCLAYWKARSGGLKIGYLLNTYRRESGRVAFHGVRAELVCEQADSIGVELIQKEVNGENYEDMFLDALLQLKSHRVEGIVFGDMDVQQNRQWSEGVCRKAGLKSFFPLWEMDQKGILEDFISSGFKAIVVAVDSRFLDEGDLGHPIDKSWLDRIALANAQGGGPGITYCGENGEYHTFVYDGPLFESAVDFRLGQRVYREGYWLLDLQPETN